MADQDLPANVCSFVFEHIDSVELLDVLILMRSQAPRPWSSEQLSNELRSTTKSVSSRLATLEQKKLIIEDPQSQGMYIYHPPSPETAQAIDDLVDLYRIKKHKIFELIFSPVKKIRFFADAFMLGKPAGKKESNDG